MRFSAVQEDGYGVGLGQETPPNDVDESMMAATGDVEPGGGSSVEEGSMISNLPLLFANGYPTSLDKITLPELERFITFMVQCSLGHDTADVINEPQWWSKEIKFSIPLVRPKKITDNYMDNLKKLVFRCYTYHRSEYLLRFCSYLAQYPHDKLEYVNNWDSTTSLYLKTTKKLLVTFRNENMNYDRIIQSPKRMGLISMNRAKAKYSNGTKCLRRRSAQKHGPSPAMVEPPMDDIYLCDNCDAEFVGLGKMKEHEKLCYRVEPRPITPEAEVEPELQQDQFMEYFKLKSSNPVNPSLGTTSVPFKDSSIQNRTSSRIRGSVNLTRCPTIPFSSPAGLALAKKSKMMTELIQQERLDRIERHLTAPPLSSTFKPKWFTKTYEFDRWSVTYKPRSDKCTKNDEYVHQYNFANYSGKLALDLRSQLLYIACKPIYVAMEVLTDEKLASLMRNPYSYKSPERKVPRVRLRPPSVEPMYDPEPGDESNPIIIDLDDDDDEKEELQQQPSALYPVPRTQTPPLLVTYFNPIISPPPITTVTAMSTMATITPIPSKSRTSLKRTRPTDAVTTRPSAAATTRSTAKPIIYVDLCSSDEDEADSSACANTTDENLDPRQVMTTTATTDVCVDPNFLRNSLLTPSKLTKPCVYPADSTSNWLSNLNVDEPRRDSFLRHTPVLRSTP